jgi:hypothetical protein
MCQQKKEEDITQVYRLKTVLALADLLPNEALLAFHLTPLRKVYALKKDSGIAADPLQASCTPTTFMALDSYDSKI